MVSRMLMRRRMIAPVGVSVAVLAAMLVAAGWATAQLRAGSGPPGSATGSSLNAVAAASPASAWAVGTTYRHSSPASLTLTEQWDGAKWAVVPSPSPGGAGKDAVSVLTGVAALSPANAWAVGYYNADSPAVLNSTHALIMHWDGTTWAQVPGPGPADSVLNGITALSPANVWAVGFTGRHTLIEHWDGAAWTRVASPSPFDSALNAVAATSRTSVWAVGHTGRGTLIEHWDGAAWKRVASPSPDRRLGTTLLAVTAVSRTDAWAAGRYQRPGETGLLEHWNGSTWRQVPSQGPVAGNVLRGIAAATGGRAWAVGSAGNLALIEHRADGKWTTVRSPALAGAAAVQLRAVTVTSGGAWAAGDLQDGAQILALIERWNGTRWQLVPAPSPGGPTWGTAIEVPGLPDASAAANSVSCASAGNCSAGGYFQNASGRREAFVVSQVNGHWGKAIEIPSVDALNKGFAAVTAVSCGTAGNCSAGGYYTTFKQGINDRHAFVVSQVHGRWGKAIQVPGTPALNAGENATVSSMSCPSPGNCSAGGSYADGSANQQVFVVRQVRGRWGKAIEVPGTAALNTGTGDVIYSLSCGSAGNCSAGGSYSDAQKRIGEAFVVSQVNGRWRRAITVPGTAAINRFGALTSSISCASAGNCVAGGYYDFAGSEAFVVSEVHGHWGRAVRVPGIAGLGTGRDSGTSSVSCGSAGNCSVGGRFVDSSGHFQVFVVSQVHGRWGKAIELPGIAALDAGFAEITSMSCRSAGNCSLGGAYGGSLDQHVFVDSQVNGRWGTPIEVPGIADLNTGMSATINSVSCGSPGSCSAVGIYNVGTRNNQRAFVVSEG